MTNAKKNDGRITKDENTLLENATAAYRRRCAREGTIYQQPASSSCVDRDGVIRLRNFKGVLAEYAVTATGRVSALGHKA